MRKDRKRLGKAAARAPNWLRTVQISKAPRRPRLGGSFGPASEVKHIRPEDLEKPDADPS